jgi:hypothetical protein
LFDLLEKFDIAMMLDRRYYDSFPQDAAAPAAFCEFNQGVVAFRQSAQMQKIIQASLDWAEDFYTRTGIPTNDQVSMRIALYSSDLRIASLPHEFNCRFHSFGYLNGKVKILHGRIPGGKHTEANLRTIAQKLNRETIPRVFVAGKVYVLARRYFFAIEHTFPRKSATLFRPWPVLCMALLKRVVRKVNVLSSDCFGVYGRLDLALTGLTDLFAERRRKRKIQRWVLLPKLDVSWLLGAPPALLSRPHCTSVHDLMKPGKFPLLSFCFFPDTLKDTVVTRKRLFLAPAPL